MIGLLATGRSGLGMLEVMGRRRVPSPPAITTAFMSEASSLKETTVWPTSPADNPRMSCRGAIRLQVTPYGELNRPRSPPSPVGGPGPHTGSLPTNTALYPI